VQAFVGGSTAQQLDLAARIGARLPLIIAVVVGLSMLLLLSHSGRSWHRCRPRL
jgi:uncharacterized membrane protein YdfJ with MMPL/SSD domain